MNQRAFNEPMEASESKATGFSNNEASSLRLHDEAYDFTDRTNNSDSTNESDSDSKSTSSSTTDAANEERSNPLDTGLHDLQLVDGSEEATESDEGERKSPEDKTIEDANTEEEEENQEKLEDEFAESNENDDEFTNHTGNNKVTSQPTPVLGQKPGASDNGTEKQQEGSADTGNQIPQGTDELQKPSAGTAGAGEPLAEKPVQESDNKDNEPKGVETLDFNPDTSEQNENSGEGEDLKVDKAQHEVDPQIGQATLDAGTSEAAMTKLYSNPLKLN